RAEITSRLLTSLRGPQSLLQGLALVGVVLLTSVAMAADDPSAAKTEAEMKPYTQKLANTQWTFDMVPIKGGEFLMGSPAKEAGRADDEGPQHKVKIEPFWMGKHEVTWDEFELWSLLMDTKMRKFQNITPTPLDKNADAITKPTPPYTDMSFGMGKD